jgi:hypothetical protein
MMVRRVLSVVVLLLCVTSLAFARPGGGQSFRSSGGSRSSYSGGGHSSWSSGGSHSSGGTGWSSSTGGSGSTYSGGGTYSGPSSSNPMGFCFGLFVVAGVVLAIVLFASARSRRAAAVRSAVLDAQFDLQAQSRRSVSLEELKTRDPNLTEASIVDRVRRMSDILRDAWIEGDMRPARPFMSDGCFSRFQVQLELMKSESVRNVMSDTKVLYVTLEAVQSNAPLDIVHVRFTAQARDATVPLGSTPQQTESALASTPVTPYTEIWTLVRRQGAQTKQSADSVGKACPSCGAPFEAGGGEIVTCKYCKALVCSGEHDWVLSEITQLSEWHPNSAEAVPGLDGLREVDLGVTRETLEDRASYLFWKWIESGRKQSPAPLRKAATPELMARSGDGADVAQGARDIAVGGADVVLCDVARHGEPQDYAYVNVFWSARFTQGAEPFPRQSTLRLARKSGASTKLSMTQVVCPSCGGPLVETDDPRCSHCGVEIVATGQVWALDAVGAPGSARARSAPGAAPSLGALVPDVRDPRERVVLFSQMAQMMTSSGLQRDEKRLLVECGKRWGIPEEVVGRALSGQLVGTAGPVASPEWFLAGLVAAALIDGTIDAQEQATLERMCAGLNLPPEALAQQITATQQRMQQRASA